MEGQVKCLKDSNLWQTYHARVTYGSIFWTAQQTMKYPELPQTTLTEGKLSSSSLVEQSTLISLLQPQISYWSEMVTKERSLLKLASQIRSFSSMELPLYLVCGEVATEKVRIDLSLSMLTLRKSWLSSSLVTYHPLRDREGKCLTKAI
jgi:hypothetical protein